MRDLLCPADRSLSSPVGRWLVCAGSMLATIAGGCSPSETEATLPVKAVRHWTMPPDGASFPAPRGMFAADNREIYVLDDAGRVLVFDRAGELQRQWRMPEYEIGRPEGICRFRDGRIAVADTHYNRVVFFDEGGQVLHIMGESGSQPGQFVYPVAITQDTEQNFYVAEYGDKHRIQKFSVGGEFLLEFGSHGTEPGQFQRPSGIVWMDGSIYVVDAFNNRVQVFRDDGRFLQILGESDNSIGLDYPYDIARSSTGDLYVVEYRSGRVTHLNTGGRVLGRFGQTGRERGEFLTPWGLTVTSDSCVLVADTGNRRIVEIEFH